MIDNSLMIEIFKLSQNYFLLLSRTSVVFLDFSDISSDLQDERGMKAYFYLKKAVRI